MSSEERISIDIREQTNNKLIFISLHYVHTCIYAITKEQNIYHRAQFIVLEYTNGLNRLLRFEPQPDS